MHIKRHYIRWQINREAKIKLSGAQAYAQCQITDISLKGLQIALALKLPKDTFLKISVVLCEEFILEVEAWVAWHRTIDGCNIYGLYFSKISDPDKEKIYRFMRTYCPQELDKHWKKEPAIEKGGAEMEDRRVFERFTVELPLRFAKFENGREHLATTRDISAKGIGLVSSEELPTHTPLEMWLQIPDKGEPLYTRGEVVWSQRLEPDKYRTGIELEQADLMGFSRVLRAA